MAPDQRRTKTRSVRTEKTRFSLATQAHARAQTQAIEMIKVKTKFGASTQAKSSEPFKLFRCEVIWIQWFHRPNITTRGKCPCASVIPKRYFAFICCSANASISASTRKRKYFDPCACAYPFLRQGRFHGGLRIGLN